MDPLSALLLAGILSTLVTRTAGAAITDAMAQSRGKTPPSLEKWRARQKQRAARGERAQEDPGPWRRRWRNAVEVRNAKAAQKHQARLEHIRDQGPEAVAKHKQRLQRRAQRWEAINSRVAGWGASSWSAAKQATEPVRERRREAQAWRENARRDQGDQSDTDSLDTEGADILPFPDSRQDEQVLAFASRPRGDGTAEITVSTGEDGDSNITGDPRDPSTWRGTDRYGRDIQTGIGPSREVSRPGEGFESSVITDSDTELVGSAVSPERHIVRQHQWQQDGDGDTEEEAPSNLLAFPGMHENNEQQDEDGDTEMNTNSTATEITDLDTAIEFSQDTARYTDTVTATLSDIVAQLEAATQGLQAEAGAYDAAQGTLSGEGFSEKLTGRFDSAQEALHAAAEAVKQAANQVSAASEQVGTAGGEMRGATQVFSDQVALQEQIGAAQQDAGAAKRTDFYSPV